MSMHFESLLGWVTSFVTLPERRPFETIPFCKLVEATHCTTRTQRRDTNKADDESWYSIRTSSITAEKVMSFECGWSVE